MASGEIALNRINVHAKRRWPSLPATLPHCYLLFACAFAWLFFLLENGLFFGRLQTMDSICRAPVMFDSIISVVVTASTGMLSWSLMVAAMMLPLSDEPIRHVAVSTPWETRKFAVLVFVASYLVLWMAVGLFMHALIMAVSAVFPIKNNLVMQWLAVCRFLVAAVWVWSPAKRSAQLNCSKTMAIRIGTRHVFQDSAHYGLVMGMACVRNCCPPMLALLLAEHGLGMMIVVASLLSFERFFLSHKSTAMGYAWIGIVF